MSNLVAVYGTLKRNEGNFRVTEASGADFLTSTVTKDKFTMYGGWGFPRVVFDGDTSPIKVEVFRVETFDYLDSLEGHPDFFCRKEIEVEGIEGKVWMYFHPPIDDQYNINVIVEDGFWSQNQQ